MKFQTVRVLKTFLAIQAAALSAGCVSPDLGTSPNGGDGTTGPSGTETVDPQGSISTNLNSGDEFQFLTGAVKQGCAVDVDLTFNKTSLDLTTTFCRNGYDSGFEEIADVGSIESLEDITSVPTSVFVQTVSAEVGHGYVVRSQQGQYYKVHVTQFVEDTTGAVLGIQLHWMPLELFNSILVTLPATLEVGIYVGNYVYQAHAYGVLADKSQTEITNYAVWGSDAGLVVNFNYTLGAVECSAAGTGKVTATLGSVTGTGMYDCVK